MAFTTRSLKIPANSASMDEAKARVLHLFKEACRSLPSVMEMYNLHDIVTVSKLRDAVSAKFRRHPTISDPKVIDMLLQNGAEELNNILEHAKQRHHIIGEYVIGDEGLVHEKDPHEGSSEFLKQFFKTNYF